jgi:hypothetical protein
MISTCPLNSRVIFSLSHLYSMVIFRSLDYRCKVKMCSWVRRRSWCHHVIGYKWLNVKTEYFFFARYCNGLRDWDFSWVVVSTVDALDYYSLRFIFCDFFQEREAAAKALASQAQETATSPEDEDAPSGLTAVALYDYQAGERSPSLRCARSHLGKYAVRCTDNHRL